MSTSIEYKYETVEAGGTTESGGTEASPNNTIVEVADIHGINKTIVMRLNPYLLATGILRENTKISYKKSDGSDAVYTVPAGSYSYTLIQVAKAIGNTNVDTLIKDNQDTLAENCCFAAGDQVLYSVGSMTNDVNDFTDEQFLITENGLTLDSIARTKDLDLSTLMKLNPCVGQSEVLPVQSIILLSVKSVTNNASVTITEFGLRVNTTRTLYVTWEWDDEKNKTKNYEVKWSWMSSDNKWWEASTSTTKDGKTKVSTYNVEASAVAAKVTIKPASESGTTYSWSSDMIHKFGTNSALTPSQPSVKIKKYTLTSTIDNYNIDVNETYTVQGQYYNTLGKIAIYKNTDVNTVLRLNPGYSETEILPVGTVVVISTYPVFIEFEIVKDHTDIFKSSGLIQAYTGHVSYSCTIDAGSSYKVRCRSCANGLYSNWSGYSSVVNALPTTPNLISVEPTSENNITLTWSKVNSAEAYSLEYVKKNVDVYGNIPKEQYFDNPSISTNKLSISAEEVVEITPGVISYSIFGLETGAEYYVRINAVNGDSSEASKWSNVETFILGIASTPPTTWSSATVGVVGDSTPLRLYWVHNSKDGSIETYARIRITVDNVVQDPIITVKKTTDKEEKYETSFYELDTNQYSEGSEIQWEVQTAGVLVSNGSPVYGEWSIKRTINIYAPPTLSMNLYDYSGKSLGKILNSYGITAFPFNIKLKAGEYSNQQPTGYYISIIANQDYQTVNEVGDERTVVSGTKVYTKYIDTSNINETITISANDVNLVNNMEYIIEATVSMSSGLTATSISYAKVRWTVTTVTPYAEITIDKETLTATIHPYVTGTEEPVLLSVYRREFDGSFTEIISEVSSNTAVVDPHPSLDYARYRIVAVNQNTGAINYNDIPGIPVEEKAIVIQWDEAWRSFDVTDTYISEQPSYAGSILKLPYNIDISNSHSQDVSLVRYIGRKRPVSYYGTHLGESATWNTVIPKRDKDTLYALRRLSIFMGNVYVREPSGSGYWASITVSFSQKHRDLSIPVTINVTPVEGGM